MRLLFFILLSLLLLPTPLSAKDDDTIMFGSPNARCLRDLTQLTPAGVVARLAEDRPLTAQEIKLVISIIDQHETPRRGRELRIRKGLNDFKADPTKGNFLQEEELQKGMSGYWTRNALNYVLKGRDLTTEQKARAFSRFAKVITTRTAKWYSPWKMEEIRNAKGDIAFLGAIHCLVILNEPQARVFKGMRPTSDPVSGRSLTSSDKFFTTWDPRKFIDVEIFEATDAVVTLQE